MSRGIPPLEERRAFTHPVTWAQIEGRCKPDGDCMVWKGSLSSGGRPYWHARMTGKQHISVSRLVVELRSGRPLGPGVLACVTCRTRGCVTHVQAMTKSQMLNFSSKAGRLGGPGKSAATAAATRGSKKLQWADVERMRALRAEGWTLTRLAEEFKVHLSMASRICAGKAWSAGAPGSSVFAWAAAA